MDMPSSSTAQPENPFDGLASSYRASKSTDPWDIFINHCGPDVKHSLATDIYDELHSMGFHVFLDKDALRAGDSFPAELQHAMATATLHIAIFSPNYAHSPWCLAELSFMLDTPATIIPIFYHVDPADLRWIDQGKGKYTNAFSKHVNSGRYTQEKLAEWKNALRKISLVHGYPINDNEDETSVLKNVVNDSLRIMKKPQLAVAKDLVGFDELVQGFRIMRIVGRAGTGKTTLAKKLYNKNVSSFKKYSFVSDVREAAASRNGLVKKQKELLSDLGLHHSPFNNVDAGKGVLANRLSSHRALIVLDDVDHIDHLNALLPSEHNLGSGSMVIVTTRQLGVLESWGVNCIYHIPVLPARLLATLTTR